MNRLLSRRLRRK